jgi:hypothetical protein
MGWLWAANSPPKNPSEGSTPPTAMKPPPPPKTEDSDFDDRELQNFIAFLQSELNSKPEERASKPPAPETIAPAQPPQKSSTSSWFSFRSSPTAATAPSPSSSPEQSAKPHTTIGNPTRSEAEAEATPHLDAISESLLPTDMSCRQAFDLAFHCQSVGGQWNAVYRNGTMRDCSENWNDFWFCMRVKGYSGRVKEDLVRAHYRAKELSKYGSGQPSSEDVWEPRRERMPWGAAFAEKYEPPQLSDEEWQRAQMERARQVRSALDK